MAEAHVLPASTPPSLDQLTGADERIAAMQDWFLANYDDPANSLPYEGKEGGYQWIWGGPYDASEEIGQAFADADEDEKAVAIEYIEDVGGVHEWTVATSRIVSLEPDELEYDLEDFPDFDPATDPNATRRRPPTTDHRAFTIVETILLPQRDYAWSVHAIFIPGDTNKPLGQEFDVDERDGALPPDFYSQALKGGRRAFTSLRGAVVALIELEIENTLPAAGEILQESIDWINQLALDSDLFVDDSIIVHASPAEWLPVAKIFAETGGVSTIVLTSNTTGHAAGLLLAYGGARIALRVVHNANYLMDAFAERLGSRIRRGDFDAGKDTKSSKKRK